MRSGKLDELTGPPGLCARCVHLRLLRSKTSTFVRCGRADFDPGFPRYPMLPVLRCRGFEAGGGSGDEAPTDSGPGRPGGGERGAAG